jgi:hypothetical protein
MALRAGVEEEEVPLEVVSEDAIGADVQEILEKIGRNFHEGSVLSRCILRLPLYTAKTKRKSRQRKSAVNATGFRRTTGARKT